MTTVSSSPVKSIPYFFYQSALRQPHQIALGYVDGPTLTYQEVLQGAYTVSEFLLSHGIGNDRQVAILAPNSPQWGITYLGILMAGATVVPILNDFTETEITNILLHSEASAIFVSSSMQSKLQASKLTDINRIIRIEEFFEENSYNPSLTTIPFDQEILESRLKAIPEDRLAAIIYTSGTTGFSKGVMLTHKNIVSNILSTYAIQDIGPGDCLLSILPLAHTYECTLGFLMPLFYGASVYYLSAVPSPSVLLDALSKVRPTMMLSVPLVIEKIYKNRIAARFESGLMKLLYRIPPTRKLFNRIAGKKLMQSFGGRIRFFGIGGALLDEEAERFLWEARFPYQIGYGLTETSPLAAGTPGRPRKFRSTGYALPGQEIRLLDVNPLTGEGEIAIRGDNVMKGYYKNEEITRSVLSPDGWFRTGDLASMDESGCLFFKGRKKNVIIGANGKNIYPEEIEAVVNRHHLVLESVVFEQRGKLIARVYLDYQKLEEWYHHLRADAHHLHTDIKHRIRSALTDIQNFVNHQMNSYSRIAAVIEQPDPFEKTPTQKIRKFKYTEYSS